MSINSGESVLSDDSNCAMDTTYSVDPGNGGGNSGAVLSPAPGLGLSAYQEPGILVKAPLPNRQGGS